MKTNVLLKKKTRYLFINLLIASKNNNEDEEDHNPVDNGHCDAACFGTDGQSRHFYHATEDY